MLWEDTICAISTGPGSGAIAIVRLSGPIAFKIARRIFRQDRTPLNGKSLEDPSRKEKPLEWISHKAMLGFIYDHSLGLAIDEVVLIPYQNPNSYTSDDLVEINCHGSAIITSEILSLCISLGARLAKPGEFTQRAFLSGKIDLTQAESVLDLIQAKTSKQSHLALSALTGHLGEQISSVRARLLELLTRIVAGIDFPEEVGPVPTDDIEASVRECKSKLEILARTARCGKFLREGIKIAIVGKPNAGKSSLLNQLLQFERAIVTDIPGTTRDSLEELIDIKGMPVTLIDTAGIRQTEDKVEKIGIERTRKTIEAADLVLFVTDITTNFEQSDQLIVELLKAKPYFVLANKCDLMPVHDHKYIQKQNPHSLNLLSISAKLGNGIDALGNAIERWAFADGQIRAAGASLNNRQSELCHSAITSLKLVEEAVNSGLPQDCLATDLKISIDKLSEICGEAVSEEVISQVFANFCVGK